MSAADAFIDAIIEKPDDDGPRLQYADWLEETGDAARAEFIRVQLQLARLSPKSRLRPKLEQRQRELLDAHQDHWFGAAAPLFQGPNREGCQFTRGMLERVALGGSVELAHASALAKLGPIRELILYDLGRADIERVADMTNLNHLKQVQITQCALTSDGLASLLRSGRTTCLWILTLSENNIGPSGCQAIAQMPMPSLQSLWMMQENIGVAGLEHLLSAPWFGQLYSLQLPGNRLGSVSVQMLCDTRHLQKLASIDLSSNLLKPDAIRAIAANRRLRNLNSLHLDHNPDIGDDGIESLTQSRYLEPINLFLAETACTSRGARAIAQARVASKLDLLELSLNFIRSQGLAYLGESNGFANCERLFLVRNEIDDDGLAAFAKSTSWRRLRHLNLGGNGIGVHGVKALTSAAHLSSLTKLELGYNRLCDRAARVLAKWPGLARLESCRISNNAIGDEGMLALARSPHLPQNGVIEARDTDVSDGARQTIQAIAPNRFRF